jgi:hypothetical protein
VICSNNDNNPASLILGKVYRTLPDAEAEAHNMLRRVVLRLWLPRHRMPEEGTSGSVGGRSGHFRLYPAAEEQKRAAHAQRSAALN